MNKKCQMYFLCLIIAIIAFMLFGIYIWNERKPCVERFEDGRIGVETIVERFFDLEDMSFICSAVFKIEENTGEGKYYIKDVTAQFIQRKRVPNEYILSSEYDVRTTEVEPGACYELEQIFIVSRNGREIGPLAVAARFSVDPDTGEMSAEDVMTS